jgi:hypothetical protein
MGVRNESFDQGAQYRLVHPQWQAGPSQAVCRARERATRQERDVLKSRISVENLNDEPVDDRGRCQKTIAPAMTRPPTRVVNRVHVEMARDVLSKLTNCGNNPLMHPRASCPMVCEIAP